MKRYILLSILTLSLALRATAQNNGNNPQQMPALSANYYDGVTFLKQSYNYEQANKKRALKRNSSDIMLAGVVVATLGYTAINYVGEQNGWSMAVTIPVGVAVAGAVIWPTTLWSNHLRKKADAIQVETAYVLPIGGHTELGAAMFRSNNELGLNSIGIGLKTTF